jgi:subtilisin family serine protease
MNIKFVDIRNRFFLQLLKFHCCKYFLNFNWNVKNYSWVYYQILIFPCAILTARDEYDFRRRNVHMHLIKRSLLGGAVLLAMAISSPASAMTDTATEKIPVIPAGLVAKMAQGQSVDVVVLFDDSQIRASEDSARLAPRERPAMRQQHYRELKKEVLAQLGGKASRLLHDYQQLPMSRARVNGTAGLSLLRSRPEIVAVFENRPIYPHLNESLPMIDQPETIGAGFGGSGASVAVVDTGIKYNHAAFGSCSSPGVPETCRVTASVDIADDDGELDDSGHGTNVSAVIAGVAPQSKLVVLDIFEDDSSSTTALVLEAMDWVLGNAGTYNIKVVNMSLGDNGAYTSACGKVWSNPFLLAINDLRESGISVVASAGNNGQTNALSMPACTPGVLSVGAVYDANLGSRAWTTCTDSTTSANKVTCFSNSASFLSILAPGALITAGGFTYGGTSQASPHVAGAVAVLAAARSDMTPDDISERLVSTGTAVTDSRNSLAFPRLNLLAALAPEIEGQSGDAPFLPAWGLASCLALFIAGVARRERHNRRR